jgi:epoxyqueuosine reductase
MAIADRTALLLGWAREGFDRAGVAALEPSAEGDHLNAWLARGDHAGMGYMARNVALRERPAGLLPGARSALCVALHYAPLAGEAVTSGDLWPAVARYARGEDYHQLFWRRLEVLAARIAAAFPGTATRACADTAPILERELAARAGLGAVGKNTNLLARQAGSWFLLGELLTTLDLEPSEPVAYDVCGNCTRCLDACPTGALPAPYRLDARRCISYWTIEHRGAMPAAAREWVGEWVFGCDVCQEVCPYNRQPLVADHPELALSAAHAELDLVALLGLTPDEHRRRFRISPLARAKREGLARNAATAMGNRRDPRYVPALAAALTTDASPVVRRHAAWALGRIGDRAARRALAAARASEGDREVGEEIAAALAGLEADPARPDIDTPEIGP